MENILPKAISLSPSSHIKRDPALLWQLLAAAIIVINMLLFYLLLAQ